MLRSAASVRDILAEEENTGKKIIIENQLEPTNHTHLGQIITYASGYDARVIVWVVKDVREEHRQAVDWLNEHCRLRRRAELGFLHLVTSTTKPNAKNTSLGSSMKQRSS